MMSGNGQGQDRGKEPVERVLDLFVHTPIGLAVMAWKRVPGLVTSVPDLVGQAVAKGCASLAEAEERLSDEVRKARMIGQVAVTFGGRQLRREVDARLRDARSAAEGVASFIPGMNTPDGSNGAAQPGGPTRQPSSATAAPPTPASAPEAPTKAAAPRKTATKPTGARKATKKAPAAKRTAKSPAPASAADLPIREYDGLSASQVVSRLTGLSPDELQAVRAYEEASRGRRTIILAIDRLLA
jgi:hypothetical protein